MFRYSSRFWLYAPLGAFLSLAALAMLHWWSVAGAFERQLAALKGHQAVPGITLNWSSVTVGGFPFRIDADFTDLRVTGQAAHGAFQWRAGKFALHALTYGREKDVYEAAGRQHVEWTDASGGHHAADFLPGALRASSIRDARGLIRADLDIVDAGAKGFTIGRLGLHMRRDPDGSDLDLMLRADALDVPGTPRRTVQVYATLDKAAALAPLLAGEKSWPDAVRDWRAQGGAAKLTRIEAPGLAADALLSPFY